MLIPEINEIKNNLKDAIIRRHPKIRNFSPGSMLDILDEIIAIQVNLMYQRIQEEVYSISILTATGSDLDALVVDRLPEGRLPGDQAIGTLTFSSIETTTTPIPIPLGSKALAIGADGSRIFFETTSYAEIGIGESSVIVPARAIEAGTKGNISAYMITNIPYPIPGIYRIENQEAFTGGTDQESDDDLRNRYFYAVLATGTATSIVIEEHLTDLEDISEAHIFPRSNGDLEVIVDYSGGVGLDYNDVYDVLLDNVAVGITCRGKLGATIRNGVITNHISECSGGRIWVRATSNALSGEAFTLRYIDILGRTRTASVIIPPGTSVGDTVEATLESITDRAAIIDEIYYSGTNSYDILIGMGQYPYMYILPRTVYIDATINITATNTAPPNLSDSIKNSITTFLNEFTIGKDLEWSDLFLYIYMNYNTSEMFTGIDNITLCQITGNGITITTPGSVINIDEDQRIRARTITVNVT